MENKIQDKDRTVVLHKTRLQLGGYINIIQQLIKNHYEKKEDNFRDNCVSLILHFNSIEENDIADMITIYMYPNYPHVWGTNDVITEENRIKKEIKDLLKEVKNKVKLLASLTGKEKTEKVLNDVLKEMIFNEN